MAPEEPTGAPTARALRRLRAAAGAQGPGTGPELVLEGTVEQGVEAGAVVLRAADGRTWLVGRSLAHLVGHRVRLRAAERRGVLTTAQQGPPLVVRDVEELGPGGSAG